MKKLIFPKNKILAFKTKRTKLEEFFYNETNKRFPGVSEELKDRTAKVLAKNSQNKAKEENE